MPETANLEPFEQTPEDSPAFTQIPIEQTSEDSPAFTPIPTSQEELPPEARGEVNGGPLGCCFGIVVGLILSLSIAITSRLYADPLASFLHSGLSLTVRIVMALAHATETTEVVASALTSSGAASEHLGSTLAAPLAQRLPTPRPRVLQSLSLLPAVLRGPDGLLRIGGTRLIDNHPLGEPLD